MTALISTLINWYVGIGLFFLLIFEILGAIYEHFNKENLYRSDKLNWKDRIATVLFWPRILYELLKDKL